MGCWVVLYRLRLDYDADELGGDAARGLFFDECAVEGGRDMTDISTGS